MRRAYLICVAHAATYAPLWLVVMNYTISSLALDTACSESLHDLALEEGEDEDNR